MKVGTPTNGHRRKPAVVRVAIYTRQSVDRGPDQDLTSCDAQRGAIAAYIESQRGEGWEPLPARYDDGGFSGANTDRPAFQKLMADIKAGKIDIVACYKIDRISRSLLDFAEIVRTFERHDVSFVSVTQSFNTATSMGVLVVNILMSFAQFERQQIGERIRDKIAASRREGYFVTGATPLGYRLRNRRLEIVEDEADLVREVFALYLQYGSVREVARELDRRSWTTRTGGKWDSNGIHRLLRNVVLVGKVSFDGEVFEGKHDAIVDQEIFDSAQTLLKENGNRSRRRTRNKWNMLLSGLLYCSGCGKKMVHTYSARGTKRHHYYVCRQLNLGARDACKGVRLNAREIEEFVVSKIRSIGQAPGVIAETFNAAHRLQRQRLPELKAEARRLRDKIRTLRRQRGNLLDAIADSGKGAKAVGERLGVLEEQLHKMETRRTEVVAEMDAIESTKVSEKDVRKALREFDAVWDQLVTHERSRLLHLLIERVVYDAEAGTVDITYRPNGIKALAGGEV